eukprot:2662400-Pyramimonas_sp.AAC.1
MSCVSERLHCPPLCFLCVEVACVVAVVFTRNGCIALVARCLFAPMPWDAARIAGLLFVLGRVMGIVS